MARQSRGATVAVRLTSVFILLAGGMFLTGPAAAAPIPCLSPPSGPELADVGAVTQWSLSAYQVTAPYPYWSVVATRGSQGYDSDLLLYDASGCGLGTSRQGGFTPTDWVAFDSNAGRLPTGMYPARVIGHSGNTSPVKYLVQFVKGRETLSTSIPLTAQPIGYSYTSWMVDIRDVYLSAGRSYTFTVTGGLTAMHVLSSSTTDPATWAKTPMTAGTSLILPGTDLNVPQTGSLTVYAPQSGWYGALFVRDGWWGAPVSVRITAS